MHPNDQNGKFISLALRSWAMKELSSWESDAPYDYWSQTKVYADAKDLDVMVKDYNATITAVDENVGKVLAKLDELKLADSTNVMFTSDNGFFLGEWRFYDKRFMHEPSIRVPMAIRYPRLCKGGLAPSEMAASRNESGTVWM